jgi:hypothetical protein
MLFVCNMWFGHLEMCLSVLDWVMNSNWLELDPHLGLHGCVGGVYLRWPAAIAPLIPSFSFSSSPTCSSNLKVSNYYSPPLNLLDFFRFLGPKRVGLWGWDLLATADAWIQESRSLAEVWRLGLGENPRFQVSGPHQDLFPWCIDIFMMLVVYSYLDFMFGWMWTYMWHMLWLSGWYEHPTWLDLVWMANMFMFLRYLLCYIYWLHDFETCWYSQVGIYLLWIEWACF